MVGSGRYRIGKQDVTDGDHKTVVKDEPGPARPTGFVAQFADSAALVAAARSVRLAGYQRWDCYSPFPVHGIDRAMGIRRTVLPWIVLGAGIAGAAAALLMQWWMNAVDYPIIISGKPLFSVPANIPVTFELIVLFSALTAFFGTIALNRLPEFTHYVFTAPRFKQATTNGFFLAIDAADPRFDAKGTADLLLSAGAVSLELCPETREGRRFPAWLPWTAIVLVLAALVPPLLIARARSMTSDQPRVHIIQDMAFQAKYKPQATSPLFADGRAARPQIAGTVAVGDLQVDDHLYRGKIKGKWAATFPMPVTDARMRRGQEMFGVYCAACHGLTGAGDGMISQRAFRREEPKWVRPASLQDEAIRKQPVGQLFDTITSGVRNMPAHGPQITVDDRWNILLYLRALQRSQNATLEDVPQEIRGQLR